MVRCDGHNQKYSTIDEEYAGIDFSNWKRGDWCWLSPPPSPPRKPKPKPIPSVSSHPPQKRRLSSEDGTDTPSNPLRFHKQMKVKPDFPVSSSGGIHISHHRHESTTPTEPMLMEKRGSSCKTKAEPSGDRGNDTNTVPAIATTVSTSKQWFLPKQEKRERTEHKLRAAREKAYEKYADRTLLHRFRGIGLLGGNLQMTFPSPRKGCPKTFDENNNIRQGYPRPRRALNHPNVALATGEKFNMEAFTIATFSGFWQPNGPNFAAQPTAAVTSLPGCMFEDRSLAVPFFIKRSLTKRGAKREGRILGWEYVGNYRYASDPDLTLWGSAGSVPDACKRGLEDRILRSAASGDDDFGRRILDHWRNKLNVALEQQSDSGNDGENDTPNSMIQRAIAMGYGPATNDKDLLRLVLELDEYHEQYIIEFVEYDEAIYKYCSKGPTSKNSRGEVQATRGGALATAEDWYNFSNENMVML